MGITLTAIGLGNVQYLTDGAKNSLREADVIYVMAAQASWIISFLEGHADAERIRRYYPRTVAWGEWHDDPIFVEIADEIAEKDTLSNSIVIVVAGDVSIYGNVTPLLPLLRERGLTWEIEPGISFLSATTLVTGDPLVGEGQSLLVTRISDATELDEIFRVADRVALYDPQHARGLREYIQSGKVSYAVSALAGVNGGRSTSTDLLADELAPIRGITVLHKNEARRATSRMSLHLGPNAWDSKGRLWAVRYPATLMMSANGNPFSLKVAFLFPDGPTDVRSIFIDQADRVIVSLKGFRKPPFGRTYISDDAGESFQMVLPRCCWGIDQDNAGNLYVGTYHERNEPDCECAIYRSSDGGRMWKNITPPGWVSQTHVHHLAVDPTTGWLYAVLGDAAQLRGCWRLKNPGDDHGKHRWTLKFSGGQDPLQFTGIGFCNGFVFLGDDNIPARNTENVLVYRGHDDGSDEVAQVEAVLKTGKSTGWGAFFVEVDRAGRLWTGARPVAGPGKIFTSVNGVDWLEAVQSTSEDIPCWRGTHTFRDITVGQTGYGRNLSGPNGEMISPLLNGSVLVR